MSIDEGEARKQYRSCGSYQVDPSVPELSYRKCVVMGLGGGGGDRGGIGYLLGERVRGSYGE